MDPDAALKDLLDAVEEGDSDRVAELSDALNGWIANGGFPPKTLGPWKLGQIWHIAVTKAILRLAKSHVGVVASQKSGD